MRNSIAVILTLGAYTNGRSEWSELTIHPRLFPRMVPLARRMCSAKRFALHQACWQRSVRFVLASRESSEGPIFGPAQFAHAFLGGVISYGDPVLQMADVIPGRFFLGEARE